MKRHLYEGKIKNSKLPKKLIQHFKTFCRNYKIDFDVIGSSILMHRNDILIDFDSDKDVSEYLVIRFLTEVLEISSADFNIEDNTISFSDDIKHYF